MTARVQSFLFPNPPGLSILRTRFSEIGAKRGEFTCRNYTISDFSCQIEAHRLLLWIKPQNILAGGSISAWYEWDISCLCEGSF